jgi:hypothetical protein
MTGGLGSGEWKSGRIEDWTAGAFAGWKVGTFGMYVCKTLANTEGHAHIIPWIGNIVQDRRKNFGTDASQSPW